MPHHYDMFTFNTVPVDEFESETERLPTGVRPKILRCGERWEVGSDGLVLEVSRPRIPCRTFAAWLAVQGWVKTFTRAATPGAYLRVIAPGTMRRGDSIVVVERPKHDVTIGVASRALTLEADLLPRLLEADALPDEIKQLARRRAFEPRAVTTRIPIKVPACSCDFSQTPA